MRYLSPLDNLRPDAMYKLLEEQKGGELMAVEKVAAEIKDIVDLNEEIEWLGEGYGGFDENGMIRGVAEGPVWWKAGGWWDDGGFFIVQR